MSEWISITDDRKPEVNQIVLVYNNASIFMAQYKELRMIYGGDLVSYEFQRWTDALFERLYTVYYKNVTHWAPLPIPPR